MNLEQIRDNPLICPKAVGIGDSTFQTAAFHYSDCKIGKGQENAAYQRSRRLCDLQQREQQPGALAFFLVPLQLPLLLK
ncbi:hypothetical protein D3C80_1562250 [compost metagenome]